jgi:acylphosphatase
MSDSLLLHLIFKGNVQGVGFRWTVVDHAEHHHLIGSVQNLEEGTVEVKAYGTEKQLVQFLEAILLQPGNATITSYEKKITPCKLPSLEGFQIVRK